MSSSHPSVTVAHWGEHCNGGGERVAWDLARAFDAPLYVGCKDGEIGPDDVDSQELTETGLPKRLVDHGGVGRMVGYQFLWELAEPLRDADVLVTSGNEPLAYVPHDGQTWVAYVHHTSRYATDLLETGVERVTSPLRGPKKLAYQAIRKVERTMYRGYAQKPDHIVVNSDVIARRVHRYWGVPKADISVVYPGVDVEDYSRAHADTGDMYLSLSRLDGHKRIDQIVDAFAELPDKRLVVAGTGSEEADLKRRAPDNVEFVGYVSEDEKRRLMSQAKAFLVNAEAEDFGITTVEALASGTPVIGVNEGFTPHLAEDGQRGIIYDRGVPEIVEAIRRFERDGVSASEADIEAFADRFGTDRFAREMRRVVNRVHDDVQVRAPWEREPEPPEETADIRVRADGGDESWQ